MSNTVWYAALVAPQKEFIAENILRQLGVECFVPFRTEWRRRNKFAKAKSRMRYAAIPRYVFIGVENNRWAPVFASDYVKGVLSENGEPRPLDEEDLASVRRLGQSAPAAHRWMRTHREFTVGEYVRIIDGAFRDHTVVVEAMDLETGRAKFRRTILGAERELWAPMASMEPA